MSGEVITMEKAAAQAPVATGPRSTMDLVQHAIINGGSMEMVEKLLSLHERWEVAQARKAFDAAIAKAKAEIPVIKKNKKGHNQSDYADLSAYAEVIPPIIGKYGLSHRYRAKQSNGTTTVICVISHEAGHFEETELSAANDKSGNKVDIHALGSTLTYLQRYTLCLALGLVSGKDDDGQAAAGKRPDEPISQEQIDELVALADDGGLDKRKFCAYYKIESFADIRTSQFDAAKKAIQKAADAKKSKGAQ